MFRSLVFVWVAAWFSVFGLVSTVSADEDEIAEILAMETAPDGVVFEVVSGDETYIETALHDFMT